MRNGKRKYGAIFLALCMLVTATMVLVPTVSADEPIVTSGGELDLDFDSMWMSDEGVYEWDDNWPFNPPYYLGEDDHFIEFGIVNNDPLFAISNVYVNVSDTGPLDFYSSAFSGQNQNIGGGGTGTFVWMFNTTTSGSIGRHALTLRIAYWNTTGIRKNILWNVEVVITSRASVSAIDTLFAGDDFKEFGLDLDPTVNIFDVYFNVTVPDADFTWGSATDPADDDIAVGWDPGMVPAAGQTFDYRIDVASDKAPGLYSADYTIDYTIGGTRYYESGADTDFLVDFTPIVEATGTIDIQQGNDTVQFPVTFWNNGNVDLQGLEVRVSPITMGAGLFYEMAYDHYEGTLPALYYDWSPIGDLDMGESGNTMLFAALDPYLPPGEHKILLEWRGYYKNEGQTMQQTAVVYVDGDWTGFAPPYLEQTSEMTTADFQTNTHTGAFIIIDVTDTELSWEAELSGTIDARGDVTSRDIYITLRNFEQIAFTDLYAELEVGPGTPFFDPQDHTATTLERELVGSSTWVGAGGTATMHFIVDVNAGYWQTDSVLPGIHMVDITVSATNDVTKARIVDTVLPVAMEITGFGPELFATMVDYGKIKPGDTFTLTIEITNFGDDTAREVDAYLRADFIAGWTIVDQFVTSISSYSGLNWWGGGDVGDASWGWETDWANYDLFNRTNEITPGDIGVDSVPQIIELNDWIKRRETPPQGRMLWIHVDRIAAGDQWTFEFEMISDVNMVEGMAYYETLDLYYVDSNGLTYGPPGSGASRTVSGQQVLIRSGKGEEYAGRGEVDWSVVLYAIIFLIIAFIVFLIGYALGGKGVRPETREEKPYEPFEEEYKPPEEEIAPPPPEEKPPE